MDECYSVSAIREHQRYMDSLSGYSYYVQWEGHMQDYPWVDPVGDSQDGMHQLIIEYWEGKARRVSPWMESRLPDDAIVTNGDLPGGGMVRRQLNIHPKWNFLATGEAETQAWQLGEAGTILSLLPLPKSARDIALALRDGREGFSHLVTAMIHVRSRIEELLHLLNNAIQNPTIDDMGFIEVVHSANTSIQILLRRRLEALQHIESIAYSLRLYRPRKNLWDILFGRAEQRSVAIQGVLEATNAAQVWLSSEWYSRMIRLTTHLQMTASRNTLTQSSGALNLLEALWQELTEPDTIPSVPDKLLANSVNTP